MTRMRKMSFVVAAVSAAGLVAVCTAPSATAADSPPTHFQSTAPTWPQASAMLGTAGSLWQPMRTAGLARKGPIDVAADSITVADGVVA